MLINNGALGGNRTPDRLVRSQVLYPAELPAQRSRIIMMRPRLVNLHLIFLRILLQISPRRPRQKLNVPPDTANRQTNQYYRILQ
jgi:hypothetical protein